MVLCLIAPQIFECSLKRRLLTLFDKFHSILTIESSLSRREPPTCRIRSSSRPFMLSINLPSFKPSVFPHKKPSLRRSKKQHCFPAQILIVRLDNGRKSSSIMVLNYNESSLGSVYVGLAHRNSEKLFDFATASLSPSTCSCRFSSHVDSLD
jgi:hypothetical protein